MNDTEGIIRIGRVSSIDEAAGTAEVLFSDRDDLVSCDFPVTVPLTCNDKFYFMPAVNERVLCALLPNDTTQGFILGSFYSEVREPPVQDKNKFHIRFEDGTVLEYDKQLHKLTVDVPENGGASLEVATAGDIEVDAQGKATVRAKGNVTVSSDGDAEVAAKGKIKLSADSDLELTGANITVASANSGVSIFVDAAGNVTVNSTGDTKINTSGSVTVNSSGEAKVESAENITVESKKDLILKGQTTTMVL